MSNAQVAWQQYIDFFIDKQCINAMIINRADATPWASTPGFFLKTYKALENQDDGTEVEVEIDEEAGCIELAKTLKKPRGGFRFNEQKYQLLRSADDGNTMYFKCKGGGATLSLSERALIFGTWQEGTAVTQATCSKKIEDLAKHLREHKF